MGKNLKYNLMHLAYLRSVELLIIIIKIMHYYKLFFFLLFCCRKNINGILLC